MRASPPGMAPLNVNGGACMCAEPFTTASSWTARCGSVCWAAQFFTGMTVSSSCV